MAGCRALRALSLFRLSRLGWRSTRKVPGSTPCSQPHRVWETSPVSSTGAVGGAHDEGDVPGGVPGCQDREDRAVAEDVDNAFEDSVRVLAELQFLQRRRPRRRLLLVPWASRFRNREASASWAPT